MKEWYRKRYCFGPYFLLKATLCNLRRLAVADAVANGRGADAQRSAGGSLTPTIG
jgi:hypothetical protein